MWARPRKKNKDLCKCQKPMSLWVIMRIQQYFGRTFANDEWVDMPQRGDTPTQVLKILLLLKSPALSLTEIWIYTFSWTIMLPVFWMLCSYWKRRGLLLAWLRDKVGENDLILSIINSTRPFWFVPHFPF